MESSEKQLCQGQNECVTKSAAWSIGAPIKLVYLVKRFGLREATKRIFLKVRRIVGLRTVGKKSVSTSKKAVKAVDEVLNLQPGELVEVKSLEEIYDTLDQRRAGYGRNKGLLFMLPMSKFCGKKYRVYKRLNRIMLGATGELKKVKNTVLLEGVICDGKDFYDCDRSCFHFWREVWLRRVEE